MTKVSNGEDTVMSFYYGYFDGSEIEGQDHDFDVNDSEFNESLSSRHSGQYPYLNYSK